MKPQRLALICAFPLLRLFYFLGGFVPRSENRWVFGTYQNSFSDNSKYFFTYVTESVPSIQATWITSDRKVIEKIRAAGGKALYRWSAAGLWHTLTSKYWFISAYASDINYYASRNACIVNLWHGVPTKKIEFDIDSGPLVKLFHAPSFLDRYLFHASLHRRPDFIASTSDHVTDHIFSSAFRIPRERCLALGNPRLDSFAWDDEKRAAWVKQWCTQTLGDLIERTKRYRKTYVYMPTFRDSNPDFLLHLDLDFAELNSKLAATQSMLVVKLHMNTPSHVLEKLRNFSNIFLMEPKDDIYPLLPLTHGLITDYSSIFFDYLLVDRPIYFFAFDFAEYLSKSRGSYNNYEEFVPGKIVKSGAALIQALFGAVDGNREDPALVKRRRELREQYLGACGGTTNCSLILHFLRKRSGISHLGYPRSSH